MEHNCKGDAGAEERATRSMDQQTTPKPQPLIRPTIETKTTPDDYELFLANWERYRDSCLKPHNHHASEIALQLWDCCLKNLQTILRSNGMVNHSLEEEMLAKMKAVTFTTQRTSF